MVVATDTPSLRGYELLLVAVRSQMQPRADCVFVLRHHGAYEKIAAMTSALASPNPQVTAPNIGMKNGGNNDLIMETDETLRRAGNADVLKEMTC